MAFLRPSKCKKFYVTISEHIPNLVSGRFLGRNPAELFLMGQVNTYYVRKYKNTNGCAAAVRNGGNLHRGYKHRTTQEKHVLLRVLHTR